MLRRRDTKWEPNASAYGNSARGGSFGDPSNPPRASKPIPSSALSRPHGVEIGRDGETHFEQRRAERLSLAVDSQRAAGAASERVPQ